MGQIHKYLLVGIQERGGRIAETQDQELISMAEGSIPCGIFALNQNEQGIHTLQIAADKEDAYQLILKTEKVVNTIHFSPGNWSGGEMDFVKDLQDHLQDYVCAAKYTGDTLVLKVYLIETPYVVTYTVKWTDGGIRFGFAMNVSLTLRDFTVDGQKNRGI